MNLLPILGLVISATNPTVHRDAVYRFIVTGDGRAHNMPSSTDGKDGINLPVVQEIEAAIELEKPHFVMWSGDLVYGYTNETAFRNQLTAWRDTFLAPLKSKGIPVLPCRGNHDQSSTNALAVWNDVFSGQFALPQNGPAAEKNLTYFYEDGDVLAILADQYRPHSFTEAGTTVTYGAETVDQEWLDTVLKTHKKRYIFAMGHEAAFVAGHHPDTMSVHPLERDRFLMSLYNAGSRIYFAGHDHFFDHMVATSKDGKRTMNQVVAGTAGAPTYPDDQYDPAARSYKPAEPNWTRTRLKHLPETYTKGQFEYGYIVVELQGKTAKVIYKERTAPGHFDPVYSFTVDLPK